MKKKLLFFAPNDYDIDVTIYDYILKLDKYEVFKLMSKKYEYKNVFERICEVKNNIFIIKKLRKMWFNHFIHKSFIQKDRVMRFI